MSRPLRTFAAGCLAGLVALAVPGVASAAVALAAGTTATGSGSASFTVTTGGPYWSVVGVRPPSGKDYDLRLLSNGTQIARSGLGVSEVDFIAVDTNRLPANAAYTAVVDPYGGATGTYTVDFANPQVVMPASGATGYVGLLNGEFLVVRDVWLDAGSNYGLLGGLAPYVFLMGDDPADRTTWARGRSQAVARTSTVNGQNCARYLAPRSGWYGAVAIDFFPDQPGHPGNGVQKYYVQKIVDSQFDNCKQY